MPMKFKTSAGSGNFQGVPSGAHIAICNMIADLGLQPGSGMYPAPKHQIYVRFETPDERVEWEKDGKKYEGPKVIGKTFTASMNEKANLRKDLESWRGRKFTDEEAENFDISTTLGKACMITVTETVKGEKTYANITAISPLPKSVPAPKPENDLLYYAEDDKSHFDKLPPWIQEKIQKQLKQKAESPTGIYAHPDNAGNYDFGQDEPPVEVYDGLGITDEDIPF